jgi:hypothetical protein
MLLKFGTTGCDCPLSLFMALELFFNLVFDLLK